MTITFSNFTSTFILRNKSSKTVRVLDVPIKPGTSVDLFKATDRITDAIVLEALKAPDGDIFREVKDKKSLEIEASNLATFNYILQTYGIINKINVATPTTVYVDLNNISGRASDLNLGTDRVSPLSTVQEAINRLLPASNTPHNWTEDRYIYLMATSAISVRKGQSWIKPAHSGTGKLIIIADENIVKNNVTVSNYAEVANSDARLRFTISGGTITNNTLANIGFVKLENSLNSYATTNFAVTANTTTQITYVANRDTYGALNDGTQFEAVKPYIHFTSTGAPEFITINIHNLGGPLLVVGMQFSNMNLFVFGREIAFIRCALDISIISNAEVSFYGCHISGELHQCRGDIYNTSFGPITLKGCICAIISAIYINQNSLLILQSRISSIDYVDIDGGVLFLNDSNITTLQKMKVLNIESDAGLIIKSSIIETMLSVTGHGNTLTFGAQLFYGSHIYTGSSNNTITGSTGNMQLGTATVAWSASGTSNTTHFCTYNYGV